MKRSLTTVNGEESLTMKRAKRYLGSDEESEVVASPFFWRKPRDTISDELKRTPKKMKQIKGPDEGNADIAETITEAVENVDNTLVNVAADETPEERQVSESPPRIKPTETVQMSDEVIPDSPSDTIRNQNPECPEQMASDTTLDEVVIQASPGRHSRLFPPSPPPSNPQIRSLLPDHSNNTPIIRPGMNNTYTSCPSQKVFPDTPTPVLSNQHSIVIQGWKERFLHTTTSTPTLTNTISNRPMTPIHTPIFRRRAVTPSIVKRPATSVRKMSSSRLVVDQIEEQSPPRGRGVILDQFRFMRQ